MASVVKRVNGTREVQLTVDGQRKTVRFGKVTAKQARSMHLNLADLSFARLSGASHSHETLL